MDRRIIAVIILVFLTLIPSYVRAEVCVTDQEAVDLITLLDASERDMVVQGKCEVLVKDLYNKVEERGKQVEDLTNQLIEAKQEIIDYRNANQTWRQIAMVTGATSIVLLAIQIVPFL